MARHKPSPLAAWSRYQPPTQNRFPEIRLPNVSVDHSQQGKSKTWTSAPRNLKQAATGSIRGAARPAGNWPRSRCSQTSQPPGLEWRDGAIIRIGAPRDGIILLLERPIVSALTCHRVRLIQLFEMARDRGVEIGLCSRKKTKTLLDTTPSLRHTAPFIGSYFWLDLYHNWSVLAWRNRLARQTFMK